MHCWSCPDGPSHSEGMNTTRFPSRQLEIIAMHEDFVRDFVPSSTMKRSGWSGVDPFDEALRAVMHHSDSKVSFLAQITFTNGFGGVYMVTGLLHDGMVIDGLGTPNLHCMWSDIEEMTLGDQRDLTQDDTPLETCVTLQETDDSGSLYRTLLAHLMDMKLTEGSFRARIVAERCTGEVTIEEHEGGSIHLTNWRGEHVNLFIGEITQVSV